MIIKQGVKRKLHVWLLFWLAFNCRTSDQERRQVDSCYRMPNNGILHCDGSSLFFARQSVRTEPLNAEQEEKFLSSSPFFQKRIAEEAKVANSEEGIVWSADRSWLGDIVQGNEKTIPLPWNRDWSNVYFFRKSVYGVLIVDKRPGSSLSSLAILQDSLWCTLRSLIFDPCGCCSAFRMERSRQQQWMMDNSVSLDRFISSILFMLALELLITGYVCEFAFQSFNRTTNKNRRCVWFVLQSTLFIFLPEMICE